MLVRVCGVVCEGGVARVALLRFIWAIIQESRLFIHFHFRGFSFLAWLHHFLGKSTILRLLLRFYRQSSGTITVDGHDITKVTGESLRRLFSVVTQDAQLFNASIRDNIAYGNMGSGDAEILAAAKLAELDLDSGDGDLSLDKICGEKGAKLSGGQQQRVSLARAMLKNGTIYLLDEPTTGLDGVVAKQLQVTLDKLSTNATSICITHHLEDLRAAHHIIYLDSGKIVERGTYEELMAADGVFATQVAARK